MTESSPHTTLSGKYIHSDKHTDHSSSQKYALITGACGGIGSVVTHSLAADGYCLYLVDKDPTALNYLMATLAGQDLNHQAISLDLTDREALHNFCLTLPHYKLDLVFINAGVVHTGSVMNQTEAQIDQQLEVNLRSAIMLNRACAKNMTAKGSGHIINTVSLGAMIPLKETATYSASKAGLRSFLTALSAELAGSGVAISGIYPSAVDTPMLHYEARNNGNVLNFVNTPQTPQAILKAFKMAIKTKKLEIYVPYSEGLFGRLICLFPNLLKTLTPILEYLGRRGLKRYLNKLDKNERTQP